MRYPPHRTTNLRVINSHKYDQHKPSTNSKSMTAHAGNKIWLPKSQKLKTTTDGTMISFESIEIIELPTVLGDHPSAVGAPLGVGWEATQRRRTSVDEYELQKTKRRSRQELHLGKLEREQRLQQNGVTMEEIREAAREGAQIRHQRMESSEDCKEDDRFDRMTSSMALSGGQPLPMPELARHASEEYESFVPHSFDRMACATPPSQPLTLPARTTYATSPSQPLTLPARTA